MYQPSADTPDPVTDHHITRLETPPPALDAALDAAVRTAVDGTDQVAPMVLEPRRMTARDNPSIRALFVGKELRRYRLAAGLEAKEVASILGMSRSTISRMENGSTTVTVPGAATLLGLYQVPAAERERLLHYAIRVEHRGWYEFVGQGLVELRELWADLETEAAQICTYEPRIVPHLLQTPEYADSVARRTSAVTNHVAVQVPSARATHSSDIAQATRLLAIIDESALTTTDAPAVLAGQLRHLTECATLPNVSLYVLPTNMEARASHCGPFTLLDFASRPSLVHTWNLLGSAVLDTSNETAIYRKVISWLRLDTRTWRESADFMCSWIT